MRAQETSSKRRPPRTGRNPRKRLFLAGIVCLAVSLNFSIAQSQVEMIFVKILQEYPLRYAPPVQVTADTSLGLLIRRLPAGQEAQITVSTLTDVNQNGVFENDEIREVRRFSSDALDAAGILQADNLRVIPLTGLASSNADQIEARLVAPDGSWLTNPAQLTLNTIKALENSPGALQKLAAAGSAMLRRILRIYDVVREDEKGRYIYALELNKGAPQGPLRKLDLPLTPVASLTVSPNGTRAAWVRPQTDTFELWLSRGEFNEAVLLASSPTPIITPCFVDEDQIAYARNNQIILVKLEYRTGEQSVPLGIRSVAGIYQAHPTDAGIELIIAAEVGPQSGAASRQHFLLRIGAENTTHMLRLPEHRLYAGLPHLTAEGLLYFTGKNKGIDGLHLMNVNDGKSRLVAACGDAGPLAVATSGSRLAFAGNACEQSYDTSDIDNN
ncbi:MAG: hypothetical protein GY868_19895 [Deltaproteobacteria bacterium]|nr:hypothetical protein [Deltaproteobacteria bacterium]